MSVWFLFDHRAKEAFYIEDHVTSSVAGDTVTA